MPDQTKSEEIRIGLPGGGLMAMDLKPFPPGAISQNLTLRAVFVENQDRTGIVLKELREAQGKDPKAGLGPNDCRVVARTAVGPVSFQVVGGFVRTAEGIKPVSPEGQPLVSLSPPNNQIEVRFSEPDPELQVARLFTTAERIRNFLAFCVGQPIPLAVLLSSGRFLNYVRLDAPPLESAPDLVVQGNEAATQEWYASIRAQYQTAKHLLTTGKPPEPLTRAISLVGEGVSNPDLEERFFYFWRALEVVGHWDLAVARKRVKESGASAAQGYFEAVSEPLLNGQYTRLDARRLVELAVHQRNLVASPSSIERLYELRTAIAHGEATPEESLEILKASQEIFNLAHGSVVWSLEALKPK